MRGEIQFRLARAATRIRRRRRPSWRSADPACRPPRSPLPLSVRPLPGAHRAPRPPFRPHAAPARDGARARAPCVRPRPRPLSLSPPPPARRHRLGGGCGAHRALRPPCCPRAAPARDCARARVPCLRPRPRPLPWSPPPPARRHHLGGGCGAHRALRPPCCPRAAPARDCARARVPCLRPRSRPLPWSPPPPARRCRRGRGGGAYCALRPLYRSRAAAAPTVSLVAPPVLARARVPCDRPSAWPFSRASPRDHCHKRFF